MAQPANAFSTYDSVGIREDLYDKIYNVDPDEVPFISALPKVKASSVSHEWQTDGLDTPSSANAHIEGDDTIAGAITPTVRLRNTCQIFKKSVTIPGTLEATTRAGRGREIAYQKMLKAKAMKTDMEMSAFANQARVDGDDNTARRLAGVPAWLTTNTSFGGGAGADPVTIGATARTDGNQRAFTDVLLDEVLTAIWTNSGLSPDCVYLGAFNKAAASGFTASRNLDIDAASKKLVNTIEVYEYDFGSVAFKPNRHVRARDAVVVRNDMWSWAELRPMFDEELAKTGDSKKMHIVAEATLVCRNEAASGIVADLTTA
jgi:hypothetical protein